MGAAQIKVDDVIPVNKQTDDDIIKEARNYLEQSWKHDSHNFSEGKKDLEMLAGNHWPEQQKREREIDGRPALTINKLPTFLNQVQNDQRQNKTSIKVSPVSDGANVETAEVFQGLIRHIEYSSNADTATDTAVNSAAAIGFGYWMFVTDYCDETSFYQDIRYQRIRNPFTVAFDPGSSEPDGSDQIRCLIHDKMTPEDFKLEHPDKTATTDSLGEIPLTHLNWLDHAWIRVARYYRIEKVPAILVMGNDKQVYWKDELPKVLPNGFIIIQERKSFKRKVMLYKLTAIEILERTEIKCRWIPVFPVYGNELDLDGKVVRSGLVRNARDPAMMYDYWMTSATEEVAMRPKTPYIGAKGFAEGMEQKWRLANNKAYPFLEYNPIVADGVMAPPPQRQPMADIPSGMLTMAMHANDNIKATTGLFDSSLGAAGNATSGRQEIAQQTQGQVTNFHYSDNLLKTQRHAGRCLVDMVPNYYDTQRIVEIMGQDGTLLTAEINKHLTDEEAIAERDQRIQRLQATGKKVDPRDQAVKTILNDVTKGKYAVVVSVGPSYTTMRKESADAMIQFGQSWPKLMDIAGDKVVKAMDWPGASEIADRIERTIPPEIKYDPKDPKAGPPPIPPEIKQQLDQAAEAIRTLNEENQRLMSGIDKELIKSETTKEIEMLKSSTAQMVAETAADAKKDVEEIKGWLAMLLEGMQPPPGLEEEVTEKEPPVEEKADKQTQLLEAMAQVLERITQTPASVRKKMSIRAPSGAVYTGEIGDEPMAPQPIQ